MVYASSGAGRLTGPLYYLDSLGLTDVILPFILVFSLTYAILKKAKIFKDNQKVDVVVSLVMALSVVIPHALGRYPANADVVNIINTALPNVGAVLIALLMVFILVGIWGVEADWGKTLHGVFVLIAFLLVGYIFGRAAGWFSSTGPSWLSWFLQPDTLSLVVILLVFGLIISYVTSDGKDKSSGESMFKSLSEMFKNK